MDVIIVYLHCNVKSHTERVLLIHNEELNAIKTCWMTFDYFYNYIRTSNITESSFLNSLKVDQKSWFFLSRFLKQNKTLDVLFLFSLYGTRNEEILLFKRKEKNLYNWFKCVKGEIELHF